MIDRPRGPENRRSKWQGIIGGIFVTLMGLAVIWLVVGDFKEAKAETDRISDERRAVREQMLADIELFEIKCAHELGQQGVPFDQMISEERCSITGKASLYSLSQ